MEKAASGSNVFPESLLRGFHGSDFIVAYDDSRVQMVPPLLTALHNRLKEFLIGRQALSWKKCVHPGQWTVSYFAAQDLELLEYPRAHRERAIHIPGLATA